MNAMTLLLILATALASACFSDVSSGDGGDGDGGGDGDSAIISGDGDGDGDNPQPAGMGSGSSIVAEDTFLEELTTAQLDMLCLANEANIAALDDDSIHCTQEALASADSVDACKQLEEDCQSTIVVDPNNETCGTSGSGDPADDGPPMDCPITVMELEECLRTYGGYLRGLACDNAGSGTEPPACLGKLMSECMELFGDGGGTDGPPVMCNGQDYTIGRDLDCRECGAMNCCDLYADCTADSACDCVNRCLNEDGGPWDFDGCQVQCGFEPGLGSELFDIHETCLRDNCDVECR